jgi:hypothetical protein
MAKPRERTDIANLAALHLDRYADKIEGHDAVALVDFSLPSWRRRLHLVDMKAAQTDSFLVAHGRGSDPAHTGWLKSFSNALGSNATSFGAYRTADFYDGKYGRSMRLIGLDAENSNAEARAIVIHPAWYVGEEMLQKYGKLGRSEGCFALSEAEIDVIFERLGPGRLLYAGKF